MCAFPFKVYGNIILFLSDVKREIMDGYSHLLYDDGCHMHKYAKSDKRPANTYTNKLKSMEILIDKFHFG